MGIDYNNSDTWATPELHSLPDFNVAAYQRKINKIFPVSVEGFTSIRLVWAPSIRHCYSRRFTEWSAITNLGTESELRAKYKFAEIQINADSYIDIPPPRWIIEERNNIGQCGPSWEAGRWAKDGREMFPPLPMEGYYSELFKVVSHEDKCCKKTPEQFVCWGKYRVPDEQDLEVLRKAKFLRDKDREIALDKPLTEDTLNILGRETQARQLKRQLEADEKMKEFVDENALELIEMITGQKNSAKTKKFSIPSNYKKENGIIVPTTL